MCNTHPDVPLANATAAAATAFKTLPLRPFIAVFSLRTGC